MLVKQVLDVALRDVVVHRDDSQTKVETLAQIDARLFTVVINGEAYTSEGRHVSPMFDSPKDIVKVIHVSDRPNVETTLNQIQDVRDLLAINAKNRQIAEQEQTISQLRANVVRLRKELNDLREYSDNNIELLAGIAEDRFDEIKKLKTQLLTEGSLEWAISQMRQGKKVRHVKWEPSEFIVLVGQTIQDEFEYTYELCGIDINEQWQLYEEPKKELAVGQRWKCSTGNVREIIAIRDGIVSYFYNGRNEPDCQRETFFLDSSAHKLLGDTA